MDKALREHAATQKRAGRKLDWRRKMSDHVAYALLVYTGLQIFVTMSALKIGSGSILPYFALIVLVAAIIPGLPDVREALGSAQRQRGRQSRAAPTASARPAARCGCARSACRSR